jgi:hypothetical protein
MTRTILFAVACLASLAACAASTPPPRAELDHAASAIAEAADEGASRDGNAVEYLHAARQELAMARRLAARQHMDRARSMARRAEADAMVARSLARERDVTRAGMSASEVRHEEDR